MAQMYQIGALVISNKINLMAIINSLVFGKAKNKIGNVVLFVTKGQTVARDYNAAPLNPRTSLQTDKRNKYFSSKRVTRELFPFYKNVYYPGRKYNSIRNWFFVQVYPFMPVRRLVNLGFTLVRLAGKSFGYNSALSITGVDLVGDHLVAKFSCSVDVSKNAVFISSFYWDSIYLELVFFEKQITVNEALSGSCDLGEYRGDGQVRAAVLNCPDLKRSSNILFAPIV